MVIRGINSFFSRHSRWLFGLFTIIIIVSFMGFLTPGQFSGCGFGGSNEIGTVFGRKVSIDELMVQRNSLMLVMRLYYGYPVNDVNEETAFGFIAQVEAARRRGLVVSDQEIARFLMGLPQFNRDGKFSAEAYKNFLNSIGEIGYTQDDIDDSVRNFLLTDRLNAEIASTVIVTENELENFYRVYNEKITVRRAEFTANDYLAKVTNDGAMLKEFFDRNQEKYVIPAQSKAILAVFEYDNPAIIAEVNQTVNEAALKEYYDANKTLFTVFEDGKEPKIRPFAEVVNSVKINYSAAKSKELALHKARLFARDAYDGISEASGDTAKIFKDMAARGKVKLIAADTFTARETKVGAVESAELVKEIINLSGATPVTNPVATDKAVYVAYAFDPVEQRPATFNEVNKEVLQDFRMSQAAVLAREDAEKTASMLNGLDAVARSEKVNSLKLFRPVPAFSMNAPEPGPAGQMISMAASTLAVGEISPVLPKVDGAMLLYVEKRIMPDMKEFAAEKLNIENIYRQFKMMSAREEFQQYISSQCKLNIQR